MRILLGLILGLSNYACAADPGAAPDEGDPGMASSELEEKERDGDNSEFSATVFEQKFRDLGDFEFLDAAQECSQMEGDDCEWRIYFASGSYEVVDSCQNFETNACCDEPIQADLETGERTPSSCAYTCERVCTQVNVLPQRGEDLGEIIRGFPAFYQQSVASERDECPDSVSVGCGPIAVAELLAWYDQGGYTRIGDDFRSNHRLDWQALAETLRNDYLGTSCNVGSTVSSTPTGRALRNGIDDFLDEVGVDHDVSKSWFRQNGVADEWLNIQESISENRPVIIGYCSSQNSGEGIQEKWDNNEDCGSHWGVIVGWDVRDDRRYVHIVTGHGPNSLQTKEFDIETSEGFLTLVYLTMNLEDKTGGSWCAAHDPPAYYSNSGGTGYSAQYGFDDYPVIQLLAGEFCARIGGESLDWVEQSRSVSCLAGACEIEATGDPVFTDEEADGVGGEHRL